MQPLYIKGFLPVQNGSMIMLPAEITQLTGSDFDIDKVFLMLPEFNIGDYINRSKLRKEFKEYLKKNKPELFDKKTFNNDCDITIDTILHNTDEKVTEESVINFSEGTFEMELNDFLEENKNKYVSKVNKVRYNFNKSFDDNLTDLKPKEITRRTNNALIDIIYGIFRSKEVAPKILDGGNFDLAKKGDRICQIASNLQGKSIEKLADELDRKSVV